jgi:hypothetical protein
MRGGALVLGIVALGACGGSTASTGPGRGGSGGSGGTGGGAAAGSAGAIAGAAGGAAGTAGAGGAGGCTITATSSLSAAISTVGIVTFTTSLASIDSAEIRFGPASTGPTMTAPVDLGQPGHRTLLLGMKPSTRYVFRIVARSSAGTCTSADDTIMTGVAPMAVPTPKATIMNAAAHARGFIVTSGGVDVNGAWIFDADGAPVWWAPTTPSEPSRIAMSWDGTKMYMMALNNMNTDGGGQITIVGMDGTGTTTAAGMKKSHHDLTAIPGGFATILWNATGTDAPCSLVERADDGTITTIVADMSSVYNGVATTSTGGKFHTNSIHYYPSDDTYTLGDRNPNLYVKVSRTGQLIWQLGGGMPKDPGKFFSGAGTWMVNHGHHLLPDGTFLLFSNGVSTNPQVPWPSVVLGFQLDTSTMTASSGFVYMGDNISSSVLGDVQRLPNGNILITASRTGVITEVMPGGQPVASFQATEFGYAEYRDSLYGPPLR